MQGYIGFTFTVRLDHDHDETVAIGGNTHDGLIGIKIDPDQMLTVGDARRVSQALLMAASLKARHEPRPRFDRAEQTTRHPRIKGHDIETD